MRVLSVLFLALALTACASVDRGLIAVSDGVYSRDPVTGERQINLVSEEEEIRRAEDAVRQILTAAKKQGLKVDNETRYYEQVIRVFNRLKAVAHRKHLPWEIHVLEDSEWNAFTIGGGKVFVFTGIFQTEVGLQNDNELAAVLAHEIAHVAARHASESDGKLKIAKLADKKLKKKDSFDASFNTVQEDEADRYSAIYMALAGYNPAAGAVVWQRMHRARGSYTGDMMFTHPLKDDRAKNLTKYAAAAAPYYKADNINPDHEKILEKNALFTHAKSSTTKVGEGGGLLALLETTANAYKDVSDARNEQRKRELKKLEQERLAAQRLKFGRLKIGNASDGGQGLFGVAMNSSGKEITKAVVVVEYLNGRTVLLREEMDWSPMQAREQRDFGVSLKSIKYSSVAIKPVYVQLADEQ
jgi:metalloendopeptidase OMA1, mitochondrial